LSKQSDKIVAGFNKRLLEGIDAYRLRLARHAIIPHAIRANTSPHLVHRWLQEVAAQDTSTAVRKSSACQPAGQPKPIIPSRGRHARAQKDTSEGRSG
jgi:hypothetical protein